MMTQTTTSPRKGGAVDVSQGSYYQGGPVRKQKSRPVVSGSPKKNKSDVGDFFDPPIGRKNATYIQQRHKETSQKLIA